MEPVAQSFAHTYTSLLAWALAWWADGGGWGLPEVRSQVAALGPVTRWATAASLALSLVAVGLVVIVRRRGDDVAGALVGAGRALLAVSAGWLVLASGWSLGGHVAGWIVGRSAGVGDYRRQVEEALSTADPVVALTLSIVGIACCLGFISVVLVRLVVAILIAAGMPVIAAGSVLGARALRTVTAWGVAVVAFEPLSAVVYRVGHALVLRAQEPVLVLLVAAVTSFLAASMLPLTARIVGPGP
ncbi:MAG: hypothetical protein U0R23_01720 [Candidatus Nanopelagicales bacterium]